jgi:hypothetical protein
VSKSPLAAAFSGSTSEGKTPTGIDLHQRLIMRGRNAISAAPRIEVVKDYL